MTILRPARLVYTWGKEGSTVDLAELSRLDLDGARELLFAYTTDLKRHEKDETALASELALWKSRESLAAGKGRPELAEAARARVADLEGKLAGLRESAATIRADIARLREALPAIRARARTVDPDRLLAELQLLTGELLEPAGSGMGTASLEREFDALERDTPQPQSQPGKEDALAALKRKMGL